MKRKNALCGDETALAVQSAIRALRRKSLAQRIAGAYSALIEATNTN